jgi:adenylyl-sulfate kinase
VGFTDSQRGRGGFTLWFTGLSGAGKTTIAELVAPELERRGLLVDRLDGDVVRLHLSQGLDFSKEGRDANIERIGWVASRLTRAGAAVVVSAISPYEAARRSARALVEEHGAFVEVYVATPVEECARRDVKGLYARAHAGEIAEFTGVSDPYEEPASPDVRIDTTEHEPEESARLVLARLEQLGLVGAAAAERR